MNQAAAPRVPRLALRTRAGLLAGLVAPEHEAGCVGCVVGAEAWKTSP